MLLLGYPVLFRCYRRALRADAVSDDRVGQFDRDPVVRVVAMLDTEVIVLELDVDEG